MVPGHKFRRPSSSTKRLTLTCPDNFFLHADYHLSHGIRYADPPIRDNMTQVQSHALGPLLVRVLVMFPPFVPPRA